MYDATNAVIRCSMCTVGSDILAACFVVRDLMYFTSLARHLTQSEKFEITGVLQNELADVITFGSSWIVYNLVGLLLAPSVNFVSISSVQIVARSLLVFWLAANAAVALPSGWSDWLRLTASSHYRYDLFIISVDAASAFDYKNSG